MPRARDVEATMILFGRVLALVVVFALVVPSLPTTKAALEI